MPASVGCLGLPLEVLLQVLRLCICNGSDSPASTADRKQLLQDRQRQSLRPRGSQITGENRRGHRDQREDDTWRHPMLRYAIRSEEHCLAFLSARYLVTLSAVSRAFRGLLSPPSSHGRALWRAAFDALVRPLTVGVSRSGPAMSASAVSDRAVLEILFSHAAWAIAPDIVQRSHFNPWDDDHVSDALRGGPAAMMALWCWLRANPSSFDTKKELLLHALAVGYRPAARLLVSPVGNTLLSFRYGAGTPRTSCRKPVRRDRSIHARGRVGMTLLQAVVYRGARLCSVPAAVPPPPDPKDSHRNEFYRLHNERNFVLEPSLPTSPWEFALADAVSFVLDADPREAAAVVNEQSCGGKTALDIAYELYAYWQRSGPWSETSFGVPGSGRHQKALKLARARTLERTIEVLRFHGGRSAIEGRDLLMFVRDLDVEGVKKELSLAVTAADSQNGMLASTGIFSARNFRGLSALPMAVDQILFKSIGGFKERVKIPDCNGEDGDVDMAENLRDDLVEVPIQVVEEEEIALANMEERPVDESDPAEQFGEHVPLAHPHAEDCVRRAAAIAQLLLDVGADPDSLAELFSDSRWWGRYRTYSYCDWGAFHAERLLGALDSVLALLDAPQQERCLGSKVLAMAIVNRTCAIRGEINLSLVPRVGVLLKRFGFAELGRQGCRSRPRSLASLVEGDRGRSPLARSY